ncbi:transglycosylase domain-containing protein [Flavobacterium sp. LAR06]|uniref:transglycosylase domain-containing protein n=1 Tax=Flavobacterium sp. LAR06 TaxID=3064897 RepID=UPI0035C1465D
MKDYSGYAVYYKKNGLEYPYGVISENYECKAISEHYPSNIKSYLIQIEDRRFLNHRGIDYKAIIRAIFENVMAGKITQGGSTITQQLARNTLGNNEKTFVRKVRETLKALEFEQNFTKDEILNLYFENVYFGKNLRGFRSAGLYYFGKDIKALSNQEWLFLLTILRGPNYYINNLERSKKRYNFLSKELLDKNLISKNRHRKNINSEIKPSSNKLNVLRNVVAPFIVNRVDEKGKKLISTIDIDTQSFVSNYIANSKYPVSIIAFNKNEVIAFGSSYGTDYPFISKSNVGSTLKPFLFCYLRDNGVSVNEKFSAFSNSLKWEVREVEKYKAMLDLEEALFYSNNNSFINAVSKIGVQKTLIFLSDLFNREQSDFFPSSILGATKKGISIYELGLAYSMFFSKHNITDSKLECLTVLNKIFRNKLKLDIENAFLKTGTTNDNKERFAVLGNPETTFVILRNENAVADYSKEGSFFKEIRRNFSSYFSSKTNYKWI